MSIYASSHMHLVTFWYVNLGEQICIFSWKKSMCLCVCMCHCTHAEAKWQPAWVYLLSTKYIPEIELRSCWQSSLPTELSWKPRKCHFNLHWILYCSLDLLEPRSQLFCPLNSFIDNTLCNRGSKRIMFLSKQWLFTCSYHYCIL